MFASLSRNSQVVAAAAAAARAEKETERHERGGDTVGTAFLASGGYGCASDKGRRQPGRSREAREREAKRQREGDGEGSAGYAGVGNEEENAGG